MRSLSCSRACHDADASSLCCGSRHQRRRCPAGLLQRAGRRPPEYAALEAAVGAINKVLAINSKIRGGGSGSADGSASGSSARGNSDASSAREAARGAREEAAALARSDPGKLVTLKARASGSKDVTEHFPPIAATSGAATAAPAAAEAATSATPTVGQTPMPWPTPARRDLRSYLGLPLEQYSLLDPRYISRLPSCDGDDAGGAQGGSSSDECAAQSGESGDKASSSGGGAAAPPVSGSFLLTVPLADIVGLELTPQLVIDVDVDERLGALGAV
ncbi:hypothetical protein MNEG_4171 [Monoraphidium neglectum]|uniref:Uncharacterized protein n=1 Tax=Monoraphidium neglectum TaxID=145388 RepID=A0A0D2MTJ7_9CHLO|nr:hypothetical protein MNEG_4171 [Monoraphidium neglectum]KIZ03782.1 hypothetical protein MNEG_4171 [Monoraphidium neglectum]|eukprot:XP_013902801.1 hypothetical protein MNEG_4171 [Monoraphidium neglectum]